MHNHMLMHRFLTLNNLSKTIPLIDSDYRVALLHTPFKGTTKSTKSKSGNGHASMTVTVPQDWNKREVQMRVLPSPSVHVELGTLQVKGNRQNQAPHPQSVPVGGRHCHFVAQDPHSNTSSRGFTEDSGNTRANILNASKERIARVSQGRSKPTRSVLWLLHYSCSIK